MATVEICDGSERSEMKQILRQLKDKRKVLRGLLTKACNVSPITTRSVALAQDKATRLFGVEEELQGLLLQLELFDEFAVEAEKAEEYRDMFLAYSTIDSDDTPIAVSASSGSVLEERGTKTIKYPEMKLTIFNGDPKNWVNFWATFENIHLDERLRDGQKLQYLRQSVSDEAKIAVFSFPPSAENYLKVVDHLKQRFGRPNLLINIYVRELMQITLSREGRDLGNLYDNLRTRLRALETLGIKSEEFAAIMCPMVESALPPDILRAFQRRSQGTRLETSDSFKKQLEDLMDFVQVEVEAEQRLKIAAQSITGEPGRSPRDVIPSAAVLHSSAVVWKCIFCAKRHHSKDCFKARKSMSYEDKIKAIQESHSCFRCLEQSHRVRFCSRSDIVCKKCSKKHYTFLCRENTEEKTPVEEKTPNDEKFKEGKKGSNYCAVTPSTVLLQTVKVKIGKNLIVRAVLDTGSDRSYISKEMVQKIRATKCGEETITHGVFGGSESRATEHGRFSITIESADRSYKNTFCLLDQEKICCTIPKLQDRELEKELAEKGIELSDTLPGSDVIHVLFGMDHLPKIIMCHKVKINDNLLAERTCFGWTVMGVVGESLLDKPMSSSLFNMSETSQALANLWELDTLGIKDPIQVVDNDQRVQQFFEKTIRVNADGRYTVRLPFKEGHPRLANNVTVVKEQLNSVVKTLLKKKVRCQYDKVMNNWIEEGIVEKVTEENEEGYYLPHFPVIREGSETFKVRPVFNASMLDSNGNSLNKCLENGPNLIETIPAILNRFRWKKCGVISDIKQAFLQICVSEEDRRYLNFLWFDENGDVVPFHHCRVVFGLGPSPYLLQATIHHHLETREATRKFSTELQDSFYVDNSVTSLDTAQEASEFIVQATEIMQEGRFELRGWRKTGEAPKEGEKEIVGLLGHLWQPFKDVIQVNINPMFERKQCEISKRGVLSCAQRVFDPIGVTSPVMLIPKLILQETWTQKLEWDQVLPEDLAKRFVKWHEQCFHLRELQIPRWVRQHAEDVVSLHTFSDASKYAYAAAVFVRSEYQGVVKVQLLQARARVAPIRLATIPRLELLGALIGVRITEEIVSSLKCHDIKRYYWTDSRVALCWIKADEQWNHFVGNRVKEIRSHTQPEQWRHVAGKDNPADFPSRGCNGKELLMSRWWEGPSWLQSTEEDWPQDSSQDFNLPEVYAEKKKTITLICKSEEPITPRLMKFEKFSRNANTLGWIFRFYNNIQKKRIKIYGPLSHEEYKNARDWLLRLMQADSFSEGDERLQGYDIFLRDNLMRVKTRLTPRETEDFFRCPILLDGKHKLTKKLVLETHKSNMHPGVGMTLSILRQEFWIWRGRQTVKQTLKICAVCRLHKAKKTNVPESSLPTARVSIGAPFETAGLDLAGPIITVEGKCWIVFYTCAVFRAVHLDVVQTLTSAALMTSLRRFIALRGRPKIIYSDCGTNITGLKNAISDVGWTEATSIEWRNNPPKAPWWGGFYERLIGVLKGLLRRYLGTTQITQEELVTLTLECAAVMNNRPLTYWHEDSNELEAITPNFFLQPLSNCMRHADLDKAEESLSEGAERLNRIREALLTRFQKEYIAFLRAKHHGENKSDILRVGDLVLIEGPEKSKAFWTLARILEIKKSADGRERVARLKTKNGELIRAFQKLYLLEAARENIDGEREELEEQETTQEDSTEESEQQQKEEDSVPEPGQPTDEVRSVTSTR